MSPNHPFLRSQDAVDTTAPADRSVGQDLDNIFRLTAAQPLHVAHPSSAPERGRAVGIEPRRVTQPDLDAALDMLGRAAKAMDLMQSSYQQVEDYAKGVADRAEKDVSVAYNQAREWQVRAAGIEVKLDDLRHRAEAAEHRAEIAERRAETAERSAKESREWLECFYDKIVSTFDKRTFMKAEAA